MEYISFSLRDFLKRFTFHEVPPRFRASAGDWQGEFVDRHPISHGQGVDSLVWNLSGEKLPQKDAVAPDVAGLRECGILDDFRRHPGVSSGLGHPRRLVDLAGQPEVGYLERFELQVVVFDLLTQQYWKQSCVFRLEQKVI